MFWQKVFAAGGEASFGRVGAFIILWFVMGWITYLVSKVMNFAADLPPLAIFLGSCIAAIATLYGISKTGEVRMTNKSKTPPPEPPVT